MNMGFIGNNVISDNHGKTNHAVGNSDHILNLDDSASSILVAVWIGLMIIGSYLLYHIHFKVLPRE